MSRKAFVFAVLLMGGVLAPTWAAAATFDISGELNGKGYYQHIEPHIGQPSFQDIYNFTLLAGHNAALHAQAFDMPPQFLISNLLMAVHAGPDGTGPLVQSAPSDLALLIPEGVPHSLVVTGDINGDLGGSYAVGITLAPVPLPASGWLMLGAFGFIALIVRRRGVTSLQRAMS